VEQYVRKWRRQRNEAVKRVFEHYGESCFYCGEVPRNFPPKIPSRLVLDHVIPRVRQGSHRAWNLVPCCFNCTGRKSAISIYESYPEKAVEWEKQIPFLLGKCDSRQVEWAVRAEQKWAGWNGEPLSLADAEALP
jgi:hypothetical protein